MATKRSKGNGQWVQDKRSLGAKRQDVEYVVIDVERCGEWMPSEELRDIAMTALAASTDIRVNVERIDHLDASAMQILLAIEAKQKNSGQLLELVNSSPKLREWFEISGAADHFFVDDRNTDD